MKGRDNKMEKKKLSVSTGLCYAGGDVGCNIVFGMIGTLLTLFYPSKKACNPPDELPQTATLSLFFFTGKLFSTYGFPNAEISFSSMRSVLFHQSDVRQ